MVTSQGKGRYSSHILKESLLEFFERNKLFPKGMVRSMDFVEKWALRNGQAMQRLVTHFFKIRGSFAKKDVNFTLFLKNHSLPTLPWILWHHVAQLRQAVSDCWPKGRKLQRGKKHRNLRRSWSLLSILDCKWIWIAGLATIKKAAADSQGNLPCIYIYASYISWILSFDLYIIYFVDSYWWHISY